MTKLKGSGQPALANTKAATPALAVADTFTDLGLDDDLVRHLDTKMDIRTPTQIQKVAIPALLHDQVNSQDTDPPHRPASLRDVFIQSLTGSGKTLTYLLPIVHRLLVASTPPLTTAQGGRFDHQAPSRSLGTFAIILVPTRELARQIYSNLETLLHLKLDPSLHRRHWMVPGIVIGGDNKNSEKARLRKGATILISTPGRLLDHLRSTQSFRVEHLKWLVLDEADRLLELGFEDTLRSILDLLGQRTSFATGTEPQRHYHHQAPSQSSFLHSPALPASRLTVLCSATLPNQVRRLAGDTLKNPVICYGSATKAKLATAASITDADLAAAVSDTDDDEAGTEATYTAPQQLEQSYLVVPAKQRLVALTSVLMNLFPFRVTGRDGQFLSAPPSSTATSGVQKAVVFVSSCDSVDYHHALLSRAPTPRFWPATEGLGPTADPPSVAIRTPKPPRNAEINAEEVAADRASRDATGRRKVKTMYQLADVSQILPGVHVYKLHGNLPQNVRTESYHHFSKSTASAILICTDVAARGLDFPHVNQIIQYDPPSEVASYVHRVGRTARQGRNGRALLFLLPSETEYLGILHAQGMRPAPASLDKAYQVLVRRRRKGRVADQAVNDVQMTYERWLGQSDRAATATHSAATKPTPAKPVGLIDDDDQSNASSESSSDNSSSDSDSSSDDEDEAVTALIEETNRQQNATATEAESITTPAQLADGTPVIQLAKSAYLSAVRAYATHAAAEKHIFHIRKLHLGHMAKAFALQETPTNVGQKASTKAGKPSQQNSQGDTATAGANGSGYQQKGYKRRSDEEPPPRKQKKMTDPFKRGSINTDEFSASPMVTTTVAAAKKKVRRAK
ncbi:ATP-dependent RNA helicase dbp7 [Tieghemiomyces parasiticus]|uniref:ATP-dependent RNA helicase n=1 Tax=Tieghemiomyces parasiticus TaxID=78921 RepID=A0A9W8A9K2_9FUNG|nr:ATP-dependent RNA helicase dbp7 [Tieghemiomyces parasiticus]